MLAALTSLLLPVFAACYPETDAVDYEGQTATDEPAVGEVADATPYDDTATGADGWDWEWGEYDDTDGIDENEFGERFGDVYEAWDTDRDAALSRSEFEAASYDWWDIDDNDMIDENEWNQVTTRWTLDDYDWDTWDSVDTDGDGHLGQTEHQELFNEEAWNGVWDNDGDGVVGRDEMADTFFDLFDGNDDNMIDENEWGDWAA